MFPRLLLICACLTIATTASAQIKPKIYILFDTSGSMTQDTSFSFQTGDGSVLCQGDGTSSRIYQLKVALFDALLGMGASEVDFALATFPMFVDPMRTPYCGRGTRTPCNNDNDCTARPGQFCSPFPPRRCESLCAVTPACSGHYYTTTATISEQYPGSAQCAVNVLECPRYACKISTHDASNQQDANCSTAACPWYPDYKKEVLKVPFGQPPEQVMFYFDQQEDSGPVTQLQNPEVRAGNGFWTPLGKSLFYAHAYFDKEVVLPATDYKKKCERLVIAFFTDGAETCNDVSSDFYYPPKWAAKLNQNLGVVTHTIAIDVNVQLLTDIANAGKGDAFNVAGTTAELKKAFLDIIAKSRPPIEKCNGEDDDCDGLTDEDFGLLGSACNNGKIGACFRTGLYQCNTAQDGVVCVTPDGGTGTNEICNGIDDNCNGQVDEGLNCPPCAAQPEICNNKDEDCDGQVDEGIAPVACGADVGECKPGLAECKPGGQLVCTGGVGPAEETCDGLDNDCDGVRDGLVEPCYSAQTGCDLQSGVCLGQCKLGSRLCSAKQQTDGSWVTELGPCTGDQGPTTEVCDGIDNNCDGQTDEQAECPGTSQCINGQCSSPCTGGEFVCPIGQLCKNNWCVLDTCVPADCEAQGGVCKAGDCIDLCKDVPPCASEFETCVKGVCVDQSCYNPVNACPAGQRCTHGECKADPCVTVSCGLDRFCFEGTCLKLCDRISCPTGKTCQLIIGGGSATTRCVIDPCADVICGPGLACVDGKCDADPCESAACDKDEICVAGECLDNPCEKISCPAGYTCGAGLCRVVGATDVLATGAGGCACSIEQDTAPPSTLWLVGLLVMVTLGRRRRRRRHTHYPDGEPAPRRRR